jgi:hypothetical protein
MASSRTRRRVDSRLAFISLAIAACLVMIGFGFSAAVTGRDAQQLPDAIESIDPGSGDRVLRQTRIFVDLVTGYEAVLVVDGIELPTVRIDQLTGPDGRAPEPGEQVVLPPVAIYDPGNATIAFQPVDGAPIEEFVEGLHEVTVVYWRSVESRERSRQYSWSFRVA